MKQIKYDLDFDRTFLFVKDRLEDVNTLSQTLLKKIEADHGYFFTILPIGSNTERLYEFEYGIVLPQNPILKPEDPSKGVFSYTPNNKWEVAIALGRLLNVPATCIFDDVRSDLDSRIIANIEQFSCFLNNEFYYVVSEKDSSDEVLYQCLRQSEAFWHSLGVITSAKVEDELTEEVLKDVCDQTTLAFIGAYDAEGYVFWAKNPGSFDFESYWNE